MNDEQMQPLLEVWLRDREIPRPKVQTGVARVMANVPRTRQQGRWWPLPVFDRPVSTFPRREPAPAPIPATNGRQPARGSTMFSALKFVVAGVIVTLFGGFLLTGVLTTQQSDEVVPAAVTESPSPMMAEELPMGMVTEEVEPGVYRVVNDGVRDLARADIKDIVVGLDDGIWLFGSDGFFRLGDERDHEWDGRWMPPYEDDNDMADIEVAPDGTVWALVNRNDGPKHLRSFDGRRWTVRKKAPEEGSVIGVEVQTDGTVWAAWAKEGGNTKAARLESDEWRVERSVDGALAVDSANPSGGPPTLAAAQDDIWLSTGNPFRLYLRDGDGWQEQDLPTDAWWVTEEGVSDVVAGPDGTLWLGTCESWGFGCHYGFARYDGSDWEWWRADDARQVEGSGAVRQGGIVGVAPDGGIWVVNSSLWVDEASSGIAEFDGQTWTDHLVGKSVRAADIAPDGTVWAQAVDGAGVVGTFVITPEAVAATE